MLDSRRGGTTKFDDCISLISTPCSSTERNFCARTIVNKFLLLLLILKFNDDIAGSYWDEVSNCSSCTQVPECGYCLSTLQCVQGDSLGPVDGSPCPSWLSEATECPVAPTCSEFDSCSACAAADDCAWCASEATCLTVSDVFSQNCRGTVFDVPCPTSFVGINRVIGNLVVEKDPIFGEFSYPTYCYWFFGK